MREEEGLRGGPWFVLGRTAAFLLFTPLSGRFIQESRSKRLKTLRPRSCLEKCVGTVGRLWNPTSGPGVQAPLLTS